MDQKTLEKVKKMLKTAAEEMNLELVSVRYLPSGEMGPTLEVLIDHDYNISMDEIQAYTDVVSPKLDEIEELNEPYTLDIASGGSQREIPPKDLGKLIGRYLDITKAKDGKTITAKLEKADDKGMDVTYFIKGRKKKEHLEYDAIASIHMGYKA